MEIHEFKMDFFDNDKPEEFLLFVRILRITLDTLGILTDNAKLQYPRNLLGVESLHQFATSCDQVGSTSMAHLKRFTLGLGTYCFPVHALSKQKGVMRRGKSTPRGLKVRHYADRMIYLNGYLSVFHGAKSSEMLFEME